MDAAKLPLAVAARPTCAALDIDSGEQTIGRAGLMRRRPGDTSSTGDAGLIAALIRHMLSVSCSLFSCFLVAVLRGADL
jgi:hypothetical protein